MMSDSISTVISYVFIAHGLFFMIAGTVGVYRFHTFYSRILITSKIESVGFLSVMFGLIVYGGISFFSLKVLVIIVLFIMTNPLSTHSICRSAYLSRFGGKDCHHD